VDFGSDFGSLLLHAKARNLAAIGIEPNSQARALAGRASLLSFNGTIQEYLVDGSSTDTVVAAFLLVATGKTAISFLNVCHQAGINPQMWSFLMRCLENADYLVLTATRNQVRKLRRDGVCVVPLLGGKFYTLNQLHLAMYSRTFMLTRLTGWLNILEETLWRIVKGRHHFPDRIATYPKMVVLASRRHMIPQA